MGRGKNPAVIGKLRLKYTEKEYEKDNNKAFPIVYEYNYDRKIIKKHSSFRARVCDWSRTANGGKGGLLKSYVGDYIRDNNRMINFLTEMDEKIREYSEKHPNKLNPDIIHSLLYGEALTRKDEGRDFVEYVKEDLSYRYEKENNPKRKIKYSRYKNGESCMKVFKQFLKSTGKGTYKPDSIYLGEISGSLIDDYISYRRNIKNNGEATINHALTPIIIALEKAVTDGLIDAKIYNEIKNKRGDENKLSANNKENFDGKYLDKEGIQKLIEFYQTDTEERRKEYIEIFLFSVYTGGLRLIDVMSLEWKDVNFPKKEIRKTQIKTQSRVTIPLTAPALQILNKWKEMKRNKKYVFDLINDDVDITNEEVKRKARNSVDKKINQSLDIVGQKMNLPFKLHFHVARHTFAINALNDKEHPMDMSQVSRLLGHSSTSVTELVYAHYIGDTLSEKMNELQLPSIPML